MSPRTVVAINTDAEQRFNELFDRHHADVFRYCLRRLNPNDAEDLAAEVFAIAWRRFDQIPGTDMARAWLLAAAYRVVGNHYRGRARRAAGPLPRPSRGSPPVAGRPRDAWSTC